MYSGDRHATRTGARCHLSLSLSCPRGEAVRHERAIVRIEALRHPRSLSSAPSAKSNPSQSWLTAR
eukprot:7333992-Prymnesium_polylepis.1